MQTQLTPAANRPGTHTWCHSGGRRTYMLGGLTVSMTPDDAEAWNSGRYAHEVLAIRCHVPTHERDGYDRRRDEMRAGQATDWYGTVGEAIAAGLLPTDYYLRHMEGYIAILAAREA